MFGTIMHFKSDPSNPKFLRGLTVSQLITKTSAAALQTVRVK